MSKPYEFHPDWLSGNCPHGIVSVSRYGGEVKVNGERVGMVQDGPDDEMWADAMDLIRDRLGLPLGSDGQSVSTEHPGTEPVKKPAPDWPDLSRTAEALAAYDRAYYDPTVEPRELDDLGAEVGQAFALDTADRNPAEVACYVRPGPPHQRGGASWLRKSVARWQKQQRGEADDDP